MAASTQTAQAVAARRQQRRMQAQRVGYGIVGIVGGLIIWEILGNIAHPMIFAPFTDTVQMAVSEFFTGGPMLDAMIVSMRVFVTGMAIAVAFGLVVGVLLARFRIFAMGFEDLLTALYVTPTVSLIPFILSLWGFGFGPKVLVVVLIATFPILFNTVEGARSIPKEMIDVAVSFRSRERHMWVHVILPYTFSFFLTGFRQAVARGLVGMVAAEFFLSASGIGQYIIIASRRFQTDTILAAVLVLMVLAVVLMGLARKLEEAFAKWR